MARTKQDVEAKEHARKRARRSARARDGRARSHARAVRREASEVRDHVYEAGRQVRYAGESGAESLGKAGTKLREAGEAGVDLARETAQLAAARATAAAEEARVRVGEAADAAQERVADTAVDLGRKAVEITVQLLTLPRRMRERARRSAEVMEETGTRVVSSVLHTGSRVLDLAADYVAELTPRRHVTRAALERLLVEQLAWARVGAEAFDRAASVLDADADRVRIVRAKLQLVRQQELVTLLVRTIGGSVPPDDRMPQVTPLGAPVDGARPALAAALSIAEQTAVGWEAIAQIGSAAEDDAVADALVRAAESVGVEPREQVEFLRGRLLHASVEAVLT